MDKQSETRPNTGEIEGTSDNQDPTQQCVSVYEIKGALNAKCIQKYTQMFIRTKHKYTHLYKYIKKEIE